MVADTAPRAAGTCRAIFRCCRCGYTSSSDLIHVVVALYTIKVFSYALRDLSVSKFHVFSKPIDCLVAATRQEPLQRRKETHHVKRLCRQWALSKRFTGGNRTSSNHEQVVRGKLFLFEVFFDSVNKQKRTKKTTMAYGMKVKKIIENQISFSCSAKFEAKESEIVKTRDCLHCGVSFT